MGWGDFQIGRDLIGAEFSSLIYEGVPLRWQERFAVFEIGQT